MSDPVLSQKTFWQAILTADYALPDGYSVEDLTPSLLDALGSPDPFWRDELAYPVLAYWIGRGLYTADHLREITSDLSLNLLKGIGEKDTDSVFRRSFSALMLATLLQVQLTQPFLARHEVINLHKRALAYLEDERDLRGYIPNKGWAHSVAHTADWLMVLAQNRIMDGNYLAHILYGIADKVKTQSGIVLIHEEDERLARAALTVLARPEITPSIQEAWVIRLTGVLDELGEEFDLARQSAYLNTKNLLRSVYIRLCLSDAPFAEALKPKILAGLQAFPTE